MAGAAQHGSVGVIRRGAAAAMARTRGGGDHRPKRDRRRRTGLGGMGCGGENLHCRSFDRGVCILQPLIGSHLLSVVDVKRVRPSYGFSVLASDSVSLYLSIEIS